MEALIMIVVPGLLGGALLAVLLTRMHASSESATGARLEPPSPSLINMAHIRVDGVGGLGMVAMALVVAVFVPRIRVTMIVAVCLGLAMAAALVALRRRREPLPSSSEHAGAHSMFTNDPPSAG